MQTTLSLNYNAIVVILVLLSCHAVFELYHKHFRRRNSCSSFSLKPLGFQKHSSVMLPANDLPSPVEFGSKFVGPSVPLLCRECLNWHLWSDQYLRDRYGGLEVNVEVGLKENRLTPSVSMTLQRFLNTYKNEDLYLVDSVPQSALGDVPMPSFLGCFGSSLVDVVWWLSNGGTRSVLHTDSLHNVICVLDGTKIFLLANRTLVSRVLDFPEEGYSSVDVDSVDACLYPALLDIPWSRVDVDSGSCLFIPYLWLHQVNSLEGRNLAVSFWFRDRFDASACSSFIDS